MRKFWIVAAVVSLVVGRWVMPQAAAVDPVQPVPQVAAKPAVQGPADPNAAAAVEEVDVLSETIGTLAGAYLNQAYVSIGILGDAVASEVYDEAEAQELLNVHLGLAVEAEKQLTALAKSPDLEPDDAAGVQQLVKIAALIRLQGETLSAVWNGDESKIAVWDKLRDQTADEIEKFFGEEESESQK